MNTTLTTELKEFNRLYKEADNLYSRYAASHGISPTMLCILYSLCTDDTVCTQTELVENWGMPMQTINSCLKTMEKNGIIRLEFAEGNRKSKCIKLTELGQKMADSVILPLVKAENQALEALGTGQRILLLELTQKHTSLLQDYLFNRE